MNWRRSFLLGVGLAAAGTVAALTLADTRPHARSEARDGAPREGVVIGPGGIPLIKAEPGSPAHEAGSSSPAPAPPPAPEKPDDDDDGFD